MYHGLMFATLHDTNDTKVRKHTHLVTQLCIYYARYRSLAHSPTKLHIVGSHYSIAAFRVVPHSSGILKGTHLSISAWSGVTTVKRSMSEREVSLMMPAGERSSLEVVFRNRSQSYGSLIVFHGIRSIFRLQILT